MIEKLSHTWMGMEKEVELSNRNLYVIFTVGVSASGKTTWAKQFQEDHPEWRIICRDDLRAIICHPFSWSAWKKHGSKGEKQVNALQDARCKSAIEGKHSVIIADTNLSSKNFLHIQRQFEEAGYKAYFKFFHVDWKTAVERDNARANGVGLSVLAHQFEKLHEMDRMDEHSVLNRAKNGKDAVLCDIDGTLAHMTTRGPYEYDKVATDSVDEEILDILDGLYKQAYEIVIVSGRDGICREATYNWLHHNLKQMRGIEFYHFQRGVGDKRPDDIVKEELLELIVEHGFKPKMVIDDRPRCFRMWRRLGLKTLIVSNPYIEF